MRVPKRIAIGPIAALVVASFSIGCGSTAPADTGPGSTTNDAATPDTGSLLDTSPAPDTSPTEDASGTTQAEAEASTNPPEASLRDATLDVPPASIDATTPGDGGACGACNLYAPPVAEGAIPSPLTELSGIVASRRHPGVFYADNDSGEGAVFYALSATGMLLGQYDLTNVDALDPEDVAVGPCDAGSCVFFGDIGDNNLVYASRAVYVVPEPDVSPTQAGTRAMVTSQALPFVYPDGRHNAETLLVHPTTGDIYVITKVSGAAATVYRMPRPFTPGVQAKLEVVGPLSIPASAGLVTGGDVHPCGTRVLIRTYPMIYELVLPNGQPFASIFAATPKTVPTPSQDQESKGEGVTYAASGLGFFTASELDGKASRSIYHVGCL